MRILAVADIFDALTADRPYREAMPLENTFAIMDDLAGTAIDTDCHTALQDAICLSGWPAPQLTTDGAMDAPEEQGKHSA
jgi:HD-GYP domain-containing protein (c-di-GMP phosphodiesterase class II)